MTKQTAHRRWTLLGFVLFLFGVVLLPSRHIVIAMTANDNHPFVCRWQDEIFVLQWRHSVEKQLWQEKYEQTGDKLTLTTTYLQAFGAGTPSTGRIIDAPDGYVGLQSNLVFDELNWMVSRNMQGVIYSPNAPDERFLIYKQVSDYTPVHINVQKKPWVLWFFVEKCHDDTNLVR